MDDGPCGFDLEAQAPGVDTDKRQPEEFSLIRFYLCYVSTARADPSRGTSRLNKRCGKRATTPDTQLQPVCA